MRFSTLLLMAISICAAVPVRGEWAARIEAGRVSWAFEDRDVLGRP